MADDHETGQATPPGQATQPQGPDQATQPMEPIDFVLAHFAALIEKLEKGHDERQREQAIPDDVPRFESY